MTDMSTRAQHPHTPIPPHAFHLWLAGIFGAANGIQTYSTFLLKALQEIEPQSSFDVFLKHDTSRMQKQTAESNTHFHFTGDWWLSTRTLVFALHLFVAGLRHRPNLIIATHLNFSPVAFWLKRLIGTRYWVIAHGVEAWSISNPRRRAALNHADKIIAVSNYTRQQLAKELGMRSEQIDVLPNTFDEERFKIGPKPEHLLERHGLSETQPVILTVARLAGQERYKGYDQILSALPQIRQVLPNVHYIIAGKGDDRTRIEQMISNLGLQECVTLAGFVPDEELCDYYNLCDLFAMPSKGEGFGIVYLEAVACGKPALGGSRDGAQDALSHGELGILVDPDDIDEIAQTVVGVLQHSYPHPHIYSPNDLRRMVIESYGPGQFRQCLERHLHEQLGQPV